MQDTDHFNVYHQAHCGRGEVLVPHNFQENTEPCPDTFSCSADYKHHLDPLRNSSNPLRQEELRYIQGMDCSKEPRMLCVPSLNQDSLFTAENIYQSFKTAKPRCLKNPCGEG